jgi:hypothetical protein
MIESLPPGEQFQKYYMELGDETVYHDRYGTCADLAT